MWGSQHKILMWHAVFFFYICRGDESRFLSLSAHSRDQKEYHNQEDVSRVSTEYQGVRFCRLSTPITLDPCANSLESVSFIIPSLLLTASLRFAPGEDSQPEQSMQRDEYWCGGCTENVQPTAGKGISPSGSFTQTAPRCRTRSLEQQNVRLRSGENDRYMKKRFDVTV